MANQAPAKAPAIAAPVTVAAPVAAPVKAATYPEANVITLTVKGAAGNPKRGKSAPRYAVYLAARAEGRPLTVAAYLDATHAITPDEPRYRWRADLAWDVKHGFITVAAPSA